MHVSLSSVPERHSPFFARMNACCRREKFSSLFRANAFEFPFLFFPKRSEQEGCPISNTAAANGPTNEGADRRPNRGASAGSRTIRINDLPMLGVCLPTFGSNNVSGRTNRTDMTLHGTIARIIFSDERTRPRQECQF